MTAKRLALFVALAVALPALAAFDMNGVPLGASEAQVKERFPQARCRALEWPSRAADRRCDDSRMNLQGIDASVTFYLRRDAVEGYDLRFDKSSSEAVKKLLTERHGNPTEGATEKRTTLLWRDKDERAELSVEQGRRRASLLVWRGDFAVEIYKVR